MYRQKRKKNTQNKSRRVLYYLTFVCILCVKNEFKVLPTDEKGNRIAAVRASVVFPPRLISEIAREVIKSSSLLFPQDAFFFRYIARCRRAKSFVSSTDALARGKQFVTENNGGYIYYSGRATRE